MTILDILPRELEAQTDLYALAWLPHEWYRSDDVCRKLGWANIFGTKGFVVTDSKLNEDLGFKPCQTDGLGTFARLDDNLHFVWTDENGDHVFTFPKYQPWESRYLLRVFGQRLHGVPDFSKDKWAMYADHVADTLEILAKVAVSGKALGLFGGTVKLR